MRRIISACLQQTMRFDTLNDVDPRKELEAYCEKLKKDNTKYVIEEEKTEPGGALVIKIRKQYNAYKTDGYLD